MSANWKTLLFQQEELPFTVYMQHIVKKPVSGAYLNKSPIVADCCEGGA